MKIENKIAEAVISALKALYGIEPEMSAIQLQKTKKELRAFDSCRFSVFKGFS